MDGGLLRDFKPTGCTAVIQIIPTPDSIIDHAALPRSHRDVPNACCRRARYSSVQPRPGSHRATPKRLRTRCSLQSILRIDCLALEPCAGVSVVCSRRDLWLRAPTLSRLRHFQRVCPVFLWHSARTQPGSSRAWIAALIFGVVLARL